MIMLQKRHFERVYIFWRWMPVESEQIQINVVCCRLEGAEEADEAEEEEEDAYEPVEKRESRSRLACCQLKSLLKDAPRNTTNGLR
jgi:hypothetical protein